MIDRTVLVIFSNASLKRRLFVGKVRKSLAPPPQAALSMAKKNINYDSI
jgi:hypothetical protein